LNSRDFTFWLQGFFELSNEDVTLSHRQLQIIKDHLNLAFDKETPDYTKEGSDEVITTDISSPPLKTEPWKIPSYTKGGMYSTQDPLVASPLGSNTVLALSGASGVQVSC